MCIYKLSQNLLAATMSEEWALLLMLYFLFYYGILPYKVSALALVCATYIAFAVYTRGEYYVDQYWVPFHDRQPTLATLVLVLIFVASFALGWIGLCLMLRIKLY